MMSNRTGERGVVSLFIVIFTALLITIVTASFVQIMLRNLQASNNSDLSQSAYDAAMAGVEDAKRGLIALKQCETGSAAISGQTCTDLQKLVTDGDECTVLGDAGIVSFDDGEVAVGDPENNQGYTCVKVQMDTDSHEGSLGDDSVVVPLRGKGEFDTVRLSWFSATDLSSGGDAEAEIPDPATEATFPNPVDVSDPFGLPKYGTEAWPATTPSLVRAQLIQFPRGDLELSKFNEAGSQNAQTLFMYPEDKVGTAETELNFNDDARREPSSSRNDKKLVNCESNFSYEGYACRVDISLPGAKDQERYLQLQGFYNKSSYKIELFDGGSQVLFNGVQPIVDSTGRAADQFRRVSARVTVTDGGLPGATPQAALSLRGNLCKNFFITDQADDYKTDGDCTP